VALADTQLELRSWLDRLAIQDLIYRYSDAVTRADWAQCEALFAPKAIWECSALGIRYESATAFLEMLKGTSTSEIMIQTPHAPVIKLIGSEKAEATTTIHEWNRMVSPLDNTDAGDAVFQAGKGEEINQAAYGVYFDDIARIDGEWKFTHRRYAVIYICNGPVTGDVVTPRSGLLRLDFG
jgi:hypothetical protein